MKARLRSPRSPRWSLLALAVVAAAATPGCLRDRKPLSPQMREAARVREEAEAALVDRPIAALAVVQDAVVRVVGPEMTCSGTLIRDDLVLTAHHCLVKRGPRREFTQTIVSHENVKVEFGGDYLPWGSVGLKAIVAPPCGEAGGRGDIAVLVLRRKMIGMTPFPPRLEEPPQRGEVLVPMGFGRCATSPDGIRRRRRDGGAVGAVTAGTFEITASICPGDSGGPLFARGLNEVVGVVSLSAMDNDETTRGLSIMARIDAFGPVFTYARAIADGADATDLPPLGCEP